MILALLALYGIILAPWPILAIHVWCLRRKIRKLEARNIIREAEYIVYDEYCRFSLDNPDHER